MVGRVELAECLAIPPTVPGTVEAQVAASTHARVGDGADPRVMAESLGGLADALDGVGHAVPRVPHAVGTARPHAR